MFPFKADDIFRSDTRSPVLSRKFFVCATCGPLHACFSPVPPIAVHNCKNICNRSIRCNSVCSSCSNAARVVNLYTLLLVHLIVLQVSATLLNSLSVNEILLISVHLCSVLLVILIFTVIFNVSCTNV